MLPLRYGRGATLRGAAYKRAGTRPAPSPAATRYLTLATHWRAILRDLKPIRGTIAEQYLRARGCALSPDDDDLRYGELRHPSGYIGPCMSALVTDARTREPLTLHRTWIKPDGTKADVDPPRLLLGKHRKKGGVIRLSPDDAVTTALAIGEGVETMLTVAHAFRPVWSAIDADNLAVFPVLDGIESLLIVADHDAPGLKWPSSAPTAGIEQGGKCESRSLPYRARTRTTTRGQHESRRGKVRGNG